MRIDLVVMIVVLRIWQVREAGRSGRVMVKPAQAGAARSSRGALSKAGNGGSYNICIMLIGGTQRVKYRARRGEQNEGTQDVIGLLHRAESGGRVLWSGHGS
jgi:hypothetical protein